MDPDLDRAVRDELASWVDHLRRYSDPVDLAAPSAAQGAETRLRISRLPSFMSPRGVRIDVRSADATLTCFNGSATVSALLPRAQFERSGLLDAVESAINCARMQTLGLDGETVLLELADRRGYRGIACWCPSPTRDADVLAVTERAVALATQFCAPPVNGSW